MQDNRRSETNSNGDDEANPTEAWWRGFLFENGLSDRPPGGVVSQHPGRTSTRKLGAEEILSSAPPVEVEGEDRDHGDQRDQGDQGDQGDRGDEHLRMEPSRSTAVGEPDFISSLQAARRKVLLHQLNTLQEVLENSAHERMVYVLGYIEGLLAASHMAADTRASKFHVLRAAYTFWRERLVPWALHTRNSSMIDYLARPRLGAGVPIDEFGNRE